MTKSLLLQRVIGLIYPFVHVKEKGLQFHHGILHTPPVEREIYMFNAPDPSGDRRQTVSYIVVYRLSELMQCSIFSTVSILQRGEESQSLANSQRAEKSKNSPLIDGYLHLLLLLLLFANIAFSIHQLLILRFLRPVVYVTLQISRINSLCVYSWPSHCVSLRTRFLQGSIVTTMQCLKNSAWTETMNMRLSGVTITFFFFANLQGSIAIAIICLKKGIVLSSHSFHCGCRAGLNILPIQKGFLTQGNICMACVRYLTCLCGSCRARQYTSIYVACTTAVIPPQT